jgi:opacity protein-like surface antigen
MKRLVLAAALAALAVPAAAQPTGAYRFELTPQLGYHWGGTLSGDDNALFDTDLDVDEGSAFGITFDIPLSSNFQLELLASRQATELEFDSGLFGGDEEVADIDISYLHAGMLWQGGNGQVNPFFVLSAGVTQLDPDVPGAGDESRFSLSLGGGVKVFFNEHVGLRFEGRGFFTAIDDYDGGCWDDDEWHCNDYYDDYQYNDTLSQGIVSAGLILAW